MSRASCFTLLTFWSENLGSDHISYPHCILVHCYHKYFKLHQLTSAISTISDIATLKFQCHVQKYFLYMYFKIMLMIIVDLLLLDILISSVLVDICWCCPVLQTYRRQEHNSKYQSSTEHQASVIMQYQSPVQFHRCHERDVFKIYNITNIAFDQRYQCNNE